MQYSKKISAPSGDSDSIWAKSAVQQQREDASARIMARHASRQRNTRIWDEEEAQRATAESANHAYGSAINKNRYVWVLLVAAIAMTVGPLAGYALRVGVVLSIWSILIIIGIGAATGIIIAMMGKSKKATIGYIFVGVLVAMSVTTVLLSMVETALSH